MPEQTAVATLKRSKFAELLASIGDGSLEDDLSEIVVGLAEKIRRMGDSSGGKPGGSLTLKLKFKYDRGVFDVDSDVKTSEPQIVRPRTLMYPAAGGGLSRNNPTQIDAFREVPVPERPVRDLAIHKGAQ